jgi:CheY-like chemotaxis protein
MARILVIDDEPAFADFAKILLEGMGHAVTLCYESSEALESALRFKPDLIITDMNMPQANGLQLIILFKGHPEFKDVPILLASASTDDRHRAEALRQGAVYSIIKPLQRDILKVLIERILSSKTS